MTQMGPRPGAFRLIMREGGQIREMGGDLTEAVTAVDFMMRQALDLGASDVHLQPERNRLLVRYRMDGVMQDVGQYSLDIVPNILARLKLAAGMHIDERREPQDGRLDMEYGTRKLSARMSCLPMLNGEKVVMRLLDPMGAKVDLDKLGNACGRAGQLDQQRTIGLRNGAGYGANRQRQDLHAVRLHQQIGPAEAQHRNRGRSC